jgi:hypothetical protein
MRKWYPWNERVAKKRVKRRVLGVHGKLAV